MPLKNRLYRRSLLATTAIVSVSVVSAAADPILSAPVAFLINNATETSAVINSSVPSVSVTGNGTLEATHGYQDFFIQADISGDVTNSGTISRPSIGNTSYSTSPSFTTRIALAAPAVIVNSDISGNTTNSGTIDQKRRFNCTIPFIPSLLQFISQFEHEYEHEYEHE